ncbi:fibronectin type III domain-containing protein [Agromyces archimandritae]|uniref:Fibronectin type III domain-containing protein n=1 Tax=Agromyces archimandritae TaxID=2781962 RepID=A0A975FMA7_9MICO|nr:fibronectin type III domain-containing protein [Agromyces archimandritae]QTX04108.1 fibronectin type III domain-containing protein [Agromyces archimandritae]
MATWNYTLAGGYQLRLIVNQGTQNVGGNYTPAPSSLRLVKGSGSGKWADGPHYWSVRVGTFYAEGSIPSYDFRGSVTEIVLWSGTPNLTHNAAGYLTAAVAAGFDDNNVWGELGDGNIASSITFSRIPKTPGAPTGLSAGATTASSVTLAWKAPGDNGGKSITEYQVQFATNSAFTAGVGTKTFSGSGTTGKTVPGLTPGPAYYFRVRARNERGYSGYSGTVSKTPALPAPTLAALTQTTGGALVVNWSAPSPSTGLTGYRVQIATNSAFSANLINVDISGTGTSYARTGLIGGRHYYVRVAARTAGGINTYSGARSHLLVLESGNLAGWSRVGTKPAAVSYFTTSGLRRGTAGGKQALWLESLSTAGASLPANAHGIQRTVTGLTVGKAYRLEASGLRSGAPAGDAYRLRVVGEGDGPAVTLGTASTSLGSVEFVADATSAVLQILLAEAVTVAGATDSVERAGFHGIRLLELATDYPQRLRETILESDLATHFDLACNSVGATWSVGPDGTTRFQLPGTALPVSAIFSDEIDDSAHSYIDVTAGYDTRAMVNRLEVTNYGVDAARTNEQNDTLVVSSPASIAAYGTRSQTLRTNLYAEAPYDESLTARLAAILDARDEPELLISQLRLNAQQDLTMAAGLDVGQRILARFNGHEQDSQIIAITHDIQPARWLVTLDLQPLE